VTASNEIDAEVVAYATDREITEVLHFTTNKGLLGILASGALRSRDRLEEDKYIEHIFAPNCQNRLKDAEWTDYVSLSISRVNGRMLGVSEEWHSSEDIWWAVLAFDASILAHPGVYFATTNNTYKQCVRRGQGVAGLRALFAPTVEWGWYGSKKVRWTGMPRAWPTDPQAEVLYPGEIGVDLLKAIYVREEERLDDVHGLFGALRNSPRPPVAHKPEVFQ
jgi:hypothetical protein